jgi:hypothetical protein
MEGLPCIDCITLPCCREYANTRKLVFMFHYSRLVRMAKKCEILNEYLGDVVNIPLYQVDQCDEKFKKAMDYLQVGKGLILKDEVEKYWKNIDKSHYTSNRNPLINYKKGKNRNGRTY